MGASCDKSVCPNNCFAEERRGFCVDVGKHTNARNETTSMKECYCHPHYTGVDCGSKRAWSHGAAALTGPAWLRSRTGLSRQVRVQAPGTARAARNRLVRTIASTAACVGQTFGACVTSALGARGVIGRSLRSPRSDLADPVDRTTRTTRAHPAPRTQVRPLCQRSPTNLVSRAPNRGTANTACGNWTTRKRRRRATATRDGTVSTARGSRARVTTARATATAFATSLRRPPIPRARASWVGLASTARRYRAHETREG